MLQVDTPVGKFRVYFTREDKKTTAHLVELQGKKQDQPVEVDSATVGWWKEDVYSHFGGRRYAFAKLLKNSPILAPMESYHLIEKSFPAFPSDDAWEARREARKILWREFWAKTSQKYVPTRILNPVTT